MLRQDATVFDGPSQPQRMRPSKKICEVLGIAPDQLGRLKKRN
jgi:hypothetical protein